MKEVRFNKEKNELLKSKRKLNFEDISEIIKKNKFVKVIEHPNKRKYQNQRMFLVEVENYIYVVPFVEEKEYIFLKTIYPSRKYTKKYLKEKL